MNRGDHRSAGNDQEYFPNRRKDPGCPSGFTLLELILVVVMMALIAGMVAPTYGEFKQGRDLQAAAQMTSSACNYARSLAVTTGRRTRLGLDPEQGRMVLLVEENPMEQPGSFNPVKWPVGISGKLPKGVFLEQVYYPVIREEVESAQEESKESGSRSAPEIQDEETALEERKSVLVFEPDGTTRDTFIYLSVGGMERGQVNPLESGGDYVTVAIVGSIGKTVIVPHYTEEIFEIYDRPGTKTATSEGGEPTVQSSDVSQPSSSPQGSETAGSEKTVGDSEPAARGEKADTADKEDSEETKTSRQRSSGDRRESGNDAEDETQ